MYYLFSVKRPLLMMVLSALPQRARIAAQACLPTVAHRKQLDALLSSVTQCLARRKGNDRQARIIGSYITKTLLRGVPADVAVTLADSPARNPSALRDALRGIAKHVPSVSLSW